MFHRKAISQLKALAVAAFCSAVPVIAAPLTVADLAILENRFFSHPFLQDPVEKRLERLECLVFGGSQAGDNESRMAKLLKTVATRSAKPLPTDAPKAAAPPVAKDGSSSEAPKTATGPSTAPGANSGQYAVLNTLEWRMLKKTYPDQSLDQRLDRLESQLFGQPAQTMAYIDRVERIKRTLGIGVQTMPDAPIASSGPAPKARPRQDNTDGFNGFNNYSSPDGSEQHFSYSAPMEPGQSFSFSFGTPGAGRQQMGTPMGTPLMSPFGFDTMFGGAAFDKQFQTLVEQMNKQMVESQRLGPGAWRYDPKSGGWIDMESGRKINPDTISEPPHPGREAAPTMKAKPEVLDKLPPYADPNSI